MCGAAGEVDVVLLSLPYFAFWAVLLGVLEWRLGAEPSDVRGGAVYANPVYKRLML